jgi:type II secretory pathway pseudopilin PulG
MVSTEKKGGQVWVETVIYTLIAFVMIGLILAFALPKIQELQDRAILRQSTQLLKEVESTLFSMTVAGNQRILEIGVRKGELKIDGVNDKVFFELESKDVYSEPGEIINDGSVIVLTEKRSGYSLVKLTSDYSDSYNITFQKQDSLKTLSKASTPYKLTLLNMGKDANSKIIMNIELN